MGSIFGFAFMGILLTETVILGLHAHSRLAWLLVVSVGIVYLFSIFFPIGIVVLVLFEQEEVQCYFQDESEVAGDEVKVQQRA